MTRSREAAGSPTLLATCLTTAVALSAVACAGPDDSPRATAANAAAAARDREATAVVTQPYGWAPHNDLAGGGSLFLGEGWGRPESVALEGDWAHFAWVLGERSTVHFALPWQGDPDLYLRCMPYIPGPQTRPQTLEVLHGERLIAQLALAPGWQDLRIPLPADLPRQELLTLTLRFGHSLSPADWGSGDRRRLSVAFTRLAVVPRAVSDVVTYLDAHRWDPQTFAATLPVRGGLVVPIVAGPRYTLRLSDLDWQCTGCELVVEAWSRAGGRELWRGASLGPLTVSLPGNAGTGVLSVGVAGSAPSAQGTVSLRLAVERTHRRSQPRLAAPHIFLYVVDTLRADALAAYGGRAALTPRMNAFAREGVTYLGARTTSSWTLPSVASLFTGSFTDRHGVMEGELVLDGSRIATLPRLLSRRGYESIAVSHSFIVSPYYGFSRLFDHFYLSDQLNSWALRSDDARALLVTWLSGRERRSPLFAYLHTVDPHAPYSPPEELAAGLQAGRFAEPVPGGLPAHIDPQAPPNSGLTRLRSLYDGEVNYTDRQFGRFIDTLRWLDLYDDSWIILTSDHGEEFAEHLGLAHGKTLFDEVLRVPLVVKFPRGESAGELVETAVSLVDVAPTLLAALGDEAAGRLDGRPLPPATPRPRATPQHLALRVHQEADSTARPINLEGLLVDGLKCIADRADESPSRGPSWTAYEVATDPRETAPLRLSPAEGGRCAELLAAWRLSRNREIASERTQSRADEEALKQLRALGYVQH